MYLWSSRSDRDGISRWSAAMMFGIYVAGDSGAYLNPAITLTNCFFRGLPLRRWPSYAISQVLGAFCGHGLVYANYVSAIDQYEGHDIRSIPPSSTSTASYFCTFPESFVPVGSRFFSEFIANFFITFLIMAVRDENGADLVSLGHHHCRPTARALSPELEADASNRKVVDSSSWLSSG